MKIGAIVIEDERPALARQDSHCLLTELEKPAETGEIVGAGRNIDPEQLVFSDLRKRLVGQLDFAVLAIGVVQKGFDQFDPPRRCRDRHRSPRPRACDTASAAEQIILAGYTSSDSRRTSSPGALT